MQTIRCTQKFQKFAGIKKSALIQSDTSTGFVGPWFVNIFWFDRRKNVLCTNADTLFSFVMLDIRKQDFDRDQVEFFREGLFRCVKQYEFAWPYLDQLLSSFDDLEYGKTNNRSVVGCMKELVYQIEYFIYHQGGISNASVSELNYRLNEEIHSPIGYRRPRELFKTRLEHVLN